jgi:SAM-dependent methyltransferase
MFSTLGMIRGRANRQRVLEHVWRIVKPGGLFILHVHNRWQNLRQPEGRRWLVANSLAWLLGAEVEPGDKFFEYRGVPGMFLHVFTRRELCAALKLAGWRIREVVPLDTERRHALAHPWLLGRLRANGWIVVCQRPAAV